MSLRNKKLVRFWFLVLAFSCLVSCAAHRPPVREARSWHIEERVYQEKGRHPNMRIDVAYPELRSIPANSFARMVNQAVLTYVNDHIAAFRTALRPDNAGVKDLGLPLRQNILKIRYRAYLVDRRDKLLSIWFHVEKVFSGHDIFSHQYMVMNYDLTQEKTLTLESLFRPGSDYLQVISRYCLKKLPEKMQLGMPWMPDNSRGLLPLPKNYQLWNLNNEGLLITFQAYQVEPYSSSAQTVLLPYALLRPAIPMQSPIGG